jgi:hypothetical protein
MKNPPDLKDAAPIFLMSSISLSRPDLNSWMIGEEGALGIDVCLCLLVTNDWLAVNEKPPGDSPAVELLLSLTIVTFLDPLIYGEIPAVDAVYLEVMSLL